jgi:hypothetical protein
MEDPNSAETKEALELLKNDDVYEALAGGLVNTLRSDQINAGMNVEADAYHILSKATGSSAYGKFFNKAMLDPSTKAGAWASHKVDKLELGWKLGLFLNLKRNMDTGKAVQKTMLAYPTYYNLPPLLNIIDNFSPYMKFFASQPRMFMYALDQSFDKTAVLFAVSQFGPAASWSFEDDDDMKKWDWYKEHGFTKIPFVPSAYYTTEFFPMFPGGSPFDTSLFDFGFVPETYGGLTDASKWIPAVSLNK